jgi:hypothetical protein
VKASGIIMITTIVLGAMGAAVAADATGGSTNAGAEWVSLFADESWYKQQAGEERVFLGKLEAVKPPQISSLMRNSLYKLGDRTIYTGVKKLPALDALVNRRVEIRGKAVDMNLEGQRIREIWPASIRPAPESPRPVP